MKCGVCGSTVHATTTDLPFKVSEQKIVILKDVPVSQCDACREYRIADTVSARVEKLLSAVNPSAELKVIRFAAAGSTYGSFAF